VDLDIVGRRNTLRKTTSIVEPVAMPWLDEDDWHTDGPGGQVLQQKLSFTYVEKEGDDSRVRYPANFLESYAIVNRDEKNAWGMERGYAVHPGLSPIHNVGTLHLHAFLRSWA
jgi:primary-amine oxidase